MQQIPLENDYFQFGQWTPVNIQEIAKSAINALKDGVDEIVNLSEDENTFDSTFRKLEQLSSVFHTATYRLHLWGNIATDKDIRASATKAYEEIHKEVVDILFSKPLYEILKKASQIDLPTDNISQKLVNDTLRGYRRLGFEKDDIIQTKVKEILKELTALGSKFQQNINEWEDHIVLPADKTSGLSASYLANLEKTESGGYIVTLKYPDYFPFMENADDEALRKELQDKKWQEGGQENIDLMKQAIKLRQELAKLLDYPDYPTFVLEERMAKTPSNVLDLLEGLSKQLAPGLETEKQSLLELKKEKVGNTDPLKYYETAFLKNLYVKTHFDVDHEKIKEFFPLQHVLEKMLEFYSTIFEVEFRATDKLTKWHEDAQIYDVLDKHGNIIGNFGLDLHPRDGKYGHAAVFPMVLHSEVDSDKTQLPFAVMVANFPKPSPENPSLMPYSQVTTLFHEFGHICHGIFSQCRYFSQSGMSVAMDFVEAPSQMLEFWLKDADFLQSISKHYQTSSPLSDETIANIIASEKFGSALFYQRQLVFGLFDLKLHSQNSADPSMLYKEIYEQKMGIELPETQKLPAGFAHIMNGYECGYYGYIWSEVFAADMFSKFRAEGILNIDTARQYKEKILAVGSSRDEMDSLRDFLGRDPKDEAFIQELGINH